MQTWQPKDIRPCYTHLSSEADNNQRYAQVMDVAWKANEYVNSGYATAVQGDLNLIPTWTDLNRLYQSQYGSGAFGKFNEVGANVGGVWTCCSKSGAATIEDGRKIDYIYFSTIGWVPATVNVSSSAYSDHHLLISYVNL